MAVARIKLEKRQFQALAARLKPHRNEPELRRIFNEIRRAADRPGLMAELQGPECDALADLTADMPDVQAQFRAMREQIDRVDAEQRVFVEGLRARLDERRGLPPAA